MSEVLVKIENLKKYFPIKRSFVSKSLLVRAVDDISMEIPRGSTYAVVGESGSGKTTLGRALLRLIDPSGGKVIMDGKDILVLNKKEFLEYRRKMQIVFQDPYNSLHPRKLIKTILSEGMKIHIKGITDGEISEKIAQVLDRVGLREEHMYRYPHEFSGGQRQRIAFARAIILNPQFIVLDEPTSALDVSVQAMVLKLLKETKKEKDLTYMFITHNLSLVDYLADYVAVMYLGQIVEMGQKKIIFDNPRHPYTMLLMNSNPIPDPFIKRKKIIVEGEIPSPINPPKGCYFHTRCPYVQERCRTERPVLSEVSENSSVRCFFPL